MEHWKKGEEESNRQKILQSIPKPLDTPNRIRSKDLFDQLMQQGISNATIHIHLKQLVKEGVINRIEESHKEVYYQQGALSKLESLLLEAAKITPDSVRQAYKLLDEKSKETFLNSLWDIISEYQDLLKEQEESERCQSKA